MLLEISKKINEKIEELEVLKNSLSDDYASAEPAYQVALAKAILTLKTGGATPITIIRDLAKGECWKEQLDKDKAKARYDLTREKIDVVKAQLNGYQTIHKHLEEI